MWQLKILRGHPRVEFKPDSSIAFEAHFETWHALLIDHVTVSRFSQVVLTARASSRPNGDHPENVHSRVWAGLGLSGEADPMASSISAVSAPLDYRGLARMVTAQGIAIAESALIIVGVEIGVDNQWPITDLPAVIENMEITITPPEQTPAPPPVASPLGVGIVRVEERTDDWLITTRWPKAE